MKNLGSYFYKPKKRDDEISKKRWNIPSIIWRAIVKTCTVVGAMILLSALISTIMFMSAGGGAQKPMPNDMVLVFNLEDGLSETQSRPTLLDPFPFIAPSLRQTVDAIHKAKDDKRVRGIVFRLNGAGIGIAHVQELREALEDFKTSGKFTKIYAPSFVDAGGGLTQYYLASIFDEVWMQPVGMFSISGPSFEMPFAAQALDKLGVKAEFLKREEFKSAMENLTNQNMSDSNKEMLNSLLGNLSLQMMSQISNDRKINMVDLGMQVDKGLLTGEEALQAKLIDRLDHADVLVEEIDGKEKLVDFHRYSKEPKAHKRGKDVALIYVTGTIVDDANARGSASGSEIASYINEAEEDEMIDAIILRVDSPGGSPSASETIRRAIVRAQEKGKKVVVSMGPVAASGGYWVAAPADRIVASAGTLTGSIGVVMGKFEASGLWEKVGVNWEGPQMGQNADLWSMNQPFDAAALERLNTVIDSTYDAFIARVAEGRKMTPEEVRKIAKGRAWTGEQAQQNGLVDVLGGLDTAKDEVAKLLGLENGNQINLVRIPDEGSKFEQFLELVGGQVTSKHLNVTESKLYKAIQPYMTQVNLFARSPVAVYDATLESFR